MKKSIALFILVLSALVVKAQTAPVNYYDSLFIINGNDTLQVPRLPAAYTNIQVNNIPPRFQWNANNGYCGEVSMISAGLYYGQYMSQFDVRKIVSGDNQQQQLLLGYNEGYAAVTLRFKYDKIQTDDSKALMTWIKHHVAQGHPVIFGVMNNVILFQEHSSVDKGDPEFDHIVPVIGFASKKPLTAGYDPSDIILFSDNGLYTPNSNPVCVPDTSVPYYMPARVDTFYKNRVQANTGGVVYSLLGLPEFEHLVKGQKDHYTENYAIAITGLMGDEETVPVRLSTSFNYENPCYPGKKEVKVFNDYPGAMSMQLTITVSNLEPGKKYNLYCYYDENLVPRSDFAKNAKKGDLYRQISITSGSTWSTTIPVQTNQKFFFRAVKADK